MTGPLDLDSVRVIHEAYLRSHDHKGSFSCCTAHASANDVPLLIAEVVRLRGSMLGMADGLESYADTARETADRISMRTLAGQLRKAADL